MAAKRLFVAVLSICLIAATAAYAATTYKTGPYKGTTGQKNPDTNKKFAMKFKISKGKISNVDTITRDRCPDGSHLRIHQNAFKSATIDSNGKFTLKAGTSTQPAVMKGKVSGSSASGTIKDTTYDPTISDYCKASTSWTAKLKVTKKK
jgi:hypothetical protein